MASTLVWTKNTGKTSDVMVLKVVITADSTPTATSEASSIGYMGRIQRVVVSPGTPNPQAGRSITILDETGADVMGGAMAAGTLTANTIQEFVPYYAVPGLYGEKPVFGKITITDSNTTASAVETLYIFIQLEK